MQFILVLCWAQTLSWGPSLDPEKIGAVYATVYLCVSSIAGDNWYTAVERFCYHCALPSLVAERDSEYWQGQDLA